MNIEEILKSNIHRPWPLPKRTWRYYQEWNDVIFLHWRVDAECLLKLVPKPLEIETYEGSAWVSLVAFSMENVRIKGLPSFSPISNFHEVNIRTYVKFRNKSGVYFLSIEGAKWLSCKIAKAMSGLPYNFSLMERTNGLFHASNKKQGSELNIVATKGEKILSKSSLDLWLTERYALFQDTKKTIAEFDIHHIPWEVMSVTPKRLVINYSFLQKYFNRLPDKSHYSSGVQVLAWDREEFKL